jgi:hypothetical protein
LSLRSCGILDRLSELGRAKGSEDDDVGQALAIMAVEPVGDEVRAWTKASLEHRDIVISANQGFASHVNRSGADPCQDVDALVEACAL